MANIFLSYLEISLPISIIIIVLLLIIPFFNKRYIAKMRYYIWIILAIRLLVPFDFTFAKETPISIPVNTDPITLEKIDSVVNDDSLLENDIINNTAPNSPNHPEYIENSAQEDIPLTNSIYTYIKNLSFLQICAFIWILGILFLILKYVMSYIYISKCFEKNSSWDIHANLILNDVSENLRITNRPPIYKSAYISSPIILGIFSPKVYIPLENIDDEKLKLILHHELTHYKRHDIFYKFIIYLSCCFHWFNPLVWLMSKQCQKDIEFSCDEEVTKGKSDEFKSLYCETILSIAKATVNNKIAFSTGFANDKHTLKQRFIQIYDKNFKRSGKLILILLFVISIISTSFISCSTNPKEEDLGSQIPSQAMDFMNFYMSANPFSDEIFDGDNYHFGFCYLLYNDMVPNEYIDSRDAYGKPDSYSIEFQESMEIYQFLFADEIPSSVWLENESSFYPIFASDYFLPRINTTPINYKTFIQDGKDMIYTELSCKFVNDSNQEFNCNNMLFIMEKQVVDYVPKYLRNKFNVGDEIWRIKDVQIIPTTQNSDPEVINIDSENDFLNFITDINENSLDNIGNKYILTNDIDLGGIKIDPIGTDSSLENVILSDIPNSGIIQAGFNGIFDGKGHTISNFTIEIDPNNMTTYTEYGGLFKKITQNGIVKNLNIKDANIVCMDTENSNHYLHSAGILAGASDGYIVNCNVQGSISGGSVIGGFVGDIRGKVENCTSNATVQGSNHIGGFAGNTEGADIKNCKSEGLVIAKTSNETEDLYRIGGFIGSLHNSSLTNCHNDSQLNITSTARVVGAFSASCEFSEILDCTYNQNERGNQKLVGYIYPYETSLSGLKPN